MSNLKLFFCFNSFVKKRSEVSSHKIVRKDENYIKRNNDYFRNFSFDNLAV